jgi:hypothetical protein
MTQSVVVHTDLPHSGAAGELLGGRIASAFSGRPPDALVLFAPPRHDYPTLLRAIHDTCHPAILVGGSSIGGFTSNGYLGPDDVCAVALRSQEMRFTVGVGRNLKADPGRAAEDMTATFQGITGYEYVHRSAIVLIDALVGRADEFMDHVIVSTGGTHQLFGGGAADGPRMSRSDLFCGTKVLSDAAVGLEILSDRPLGVGLCHGWQPISDRMRVTEAKGARILSLNGMVAVDAFQVHAEATRQSFDPRNPMPFFLDNVIGIESGNGYRLRVPIAVNDDGSVSCAAEVPSGQTVRIMATTAKLASDAAEQGVRRAREQLGNGKPQLAIFFDCLASEARMNLGFGVDPRSLALPLGTANYVGFSTCGQLVRCEGEFNGFQNCTAVVCVFPE